MFESSNIPVFQFSAFRYSGLPVFQSSSRPVFRYSSHCLGLRGRSILFPTGHFLGQGSGKGPARVEYGRLGADMVELGR